MDRNKEVSTDQGPPGDILFQPGTARVRLSGRWDSCFLEGVDKRLEEGLPALPGKAEIALDASAIGRMDTAGALMLFKLIGQLQRRGVPYRVEGLQSSHQALLDLTRRRFPEREPAPAAVATGFLPATGRYSWQLLTELSALLAFVGEAAIQLLGSVFHPRRIRWRELLDEMHRGGVTALPILGLLSFLIGVVIAYQGGVQLSRYGADIYIVDLVALTTVRELAPLLTAIIVAGRTGSAYTAQIGTMCVTEEIAALKTIGIKPMDLLVVPKMLSLVLVLPLLTLFADLMSILGGMLMAQGLLGVEPQIFIDRIPTAVSVRSYLLGIGKTPVFALIIAVVGCFQGFQVRGGADAVGRQTTLSVVEAIFLVIVADAAFSILFSWLRI